MIYVKGKIGGMALNTVRQDSWTQDEDLLLAEVVLRHIREGSTQLSAFEEVGEKLSRTPAACGFRWNSLVRKKYETAISLAKKQRKKTKKGEENIQETPHSMEASDNQEIPQAYTPNISIDDIVQFLQSLKESQLKHEALASENEKLIARINKVENEKNELNEQYLKLQKEYQLINEDYKSLIGIMDRARKMVTTDDQDSQGRISKNYNRTVEK